MKKEKLTTLLIFVIGTELVGALSALLSGGGFSAYYQSLNQPPFAPPGWLFPVAWGILYALMGISAYQVWRADLVGSKAALFLYAAQLAVNFLWSPVFFGLRSLPGAVAVILALDLLVTAMIAAFLRVRRTAGLLNVPYLLWTLYATYLCIGVLRLNG